MSETFRGRRMAEQSAWAVYSLVGSTDPEWLLRGWTVRPTRQNSIEAYGRASYEGDRKAGRAMCLRVVVRPHLAQEGGER